MNKSTHHQSWRALILQLVWLAIDPCWCLTRPESHPHDSEPSLATSAVTMDRTIIGLQSTLSVAEDPGRIWKSHKRTPNHVQSKTAKTKQNLDPALSSLDSLHAHRILWIPGQQPPPPPSKSTRALPGTSRVCAMLASERMDALNSCN